MKIDNNETVFDYSTMNEIINEGMKEEKRKALYKNLWFEKELTIYSEKQIVVKAYLHFK